MHPIQPTKQRQTIYSANFYNSIIYSVLLAIVVTNNHSFSTSISHIKRPSSVANKLIAEIEDEAKRSDNETEKIKIKPLNIPEI